MPKIRFNAVTWYSKMLSYLFIFGAFPVIVFYVGIRYYQTVEVLTHGYASASEIYLDGTYDQKSFQGTGSYQARKDIEGDWISIDDDSYVMAVKDNNVLYEKRDGDISASGSWIIRDSLRGTRFENLPTGLYLQKNILAKGGKEEIQYFKIIALTPTSLELSHLDRVGTSRFRKSDPSSVQKRAL